MVTIPARVLADVLAARRFALAQTALARLSGLAVSADMEEMTTAATSTAATLVGVASAALARHENPHDQFLRMTAVTHVLHTGVEVRAGAGSLAGYTLTQGQLTVCSDAVTETRFDTSAMSTVGFRSGAAVPVMTSIGVWGVLLVYGTEPNLFDDTDIAFLSAVAGVLSAALERVDLSRRLRERNEHDPLTGLPDRTLAYSAVGDALSRAREQGDGVALLLLDIDDFAIINDSLGHDTGDRALARFADRLVAAVRSRDTVYRLGGDEFLVICDGVDDARRAEDLAFRITAALAAPPSAADAPIPLSASIGIAVSENGITVRELLRRADLALHRAKDGGGGAHAIFDAEDDHYDADRVRSLSVDLRASLSRGELTLAYQPLVDIATGAVVSVEALARWDHPTLGRIEPSEFVAVAERTGLAAVLGEWALRSACRQAASWREAFRITVRVNVSALQLRDPAFPERVSSVLRETGLPPQALGLEVTETVWLADTGRVARNVAAVNEMGVALVLDDVGAGHSSLAYLERFSVFECFKIDKGYIDAVETRRGRAVVSAIVALAKAYEMTVVGEGVETRAQLDALAETGCDLAQGFLLGRPVDAEQTTAVLELRASPAEAVGGI
jgi:diguanylate cyclase (GGDEF)-like protein